MAYEPKDIQGWMSTEDLLWLYKKASEMNSVVEVGSWKGRSTHALLSGCPGIVYAVDHFKGNPEELDGPHREAVNGDIYGQFLANVGEFPNLRVLKGESVEMSKQFADSSVDMVFIDGSHLYEAVLADIQAWLPKCRKLICGHDLGMLGVDNALQALKLKYSTVIDSIWAVEIPEKEKS